jgi:DNA-binding transcriptional LysR family regulator
VRAISELDLIVVTAPELAKRATSFPDGLAGMPFVKYTRRSAYRWQVDAFLANVTPEPDVRGEVDDVQLLIYAAEQGQCAAAVPEPAAAASVADGKLVCLGRVDDKGAKVYAHYSAHDASDLVQAAIDSLSNAPPGETKAEAAGQ